MANRETYQDGLILERWTNEGAAGYYAGTPLVRQRALTSAEAADLAAADTASTQLTNRDAITSKALAALTANANVPTTNATYVGLASPTTAQNTAQIKALSNQNSAFARELSALIRLLLNQLDDTSGT